MHNKQLIHILVLLLLFILQALYIILTEASISTPLIMKEAVVFELNSTCDTEKTITCKGVYGCDKIMCEALNEANGYVALEPFGDNNDCTATTNLGRIMDVVGYKIAIIMIIIASAIYILTVIVSLCSYITNSRKTKHIITMTFVLSNACLLVSLLFGVIVGRQETDSQNASETTTTFSACGYAIFSIIIILETIWGILCMIKKNKKIYAPINFN